MIPSRDRIVQPEVVGSIEFDAVDDQVAVPLAGVGSIGAVVVIDELDGDAVLTGLDRDPLRVLCGLAFGDDVKGSDLPAVEVEGHPRRVRTGLLPVGVDADGIGSTCRRLKEELELTARPQIPAPVPGGLPPGVPPAPRRDRSCA